MYLVFGTTLLLAALFGCARTLMVALKWRRKKLEEQKGKEALLGLFDSFETPLLHVNSSNIVRHANASFAKILEKKRFWFEGAHLRDLLGTDIYEVITSHLEQSGHQEGEKALMFGLPSKFSESVFYPYQFKIYRSQYSSQKKGDYMLMFLESTAEPLDRGEDESDKLLLQKYLGEVEHSRMELKRSTEELNEARNEAVRATRAKSAFLANMSHEIRTPMNGLIGMASLLAESSLTNEQLECVKVIEESSHSLLNLINDILDFSKVEAGKVELHNVCIDLSQSLKRSAALFQYSLDKKKITFEMHMDENVPPYILVDDTRLLQVINNLMNNAIKFTPEGGIITLHVNYLKSLDEQDVLQFCVADSGVGMSAEAQKKIFNAFEQADSSTTREYGGTGLGLSICNGLVKLMKGDIWVKSKPGDGTSFYFTIQSGRPSVTQIEELKDRQATDLLPATDAGQQHPLRILVAEDNIVNQKVIVRMLQAMGHDVALVDNGESAIDSLMNVPFDLVLMDCQMPVLDGYEATRQIRKYQWGKDIPIIAFTANAIDGEIEKCLDAGMNDYVSKPINKRDLEKKIKLFYENKSDQ